MGLFLQFFCQNPKALCFLELWTKQCRCSKCSLGGLHPLSSVITLVLSGLAQQLLSAGALDVSSGREKDGVGCRDETEMLREAGSREGRSLCT